MAIVGVILVTAVFYRPLRSQYLEDSKRPASEPQVHEEPPKALPPTGTSPVVKPPPKHPVQPATKPTPQSPPPAQTAPVYGNLKQRCLQLSGELIEFASNREGLMNNRYPHVSADEFNGWRLGTDRIFRMRHARQIKDLRDELATFHFKDVELDEILDGDDRNEQSRNLPRESPSYGSGWIATSHIRGIGERLAVLAKRIPDN
jgi:hypothetical protein